MNLQLSKIAEVIGGTLIGEDLVAYGVSTDTRDIQKGNVFFALHGESFNGEAFVERAFEKGAIASILTRHQRDLKQPQIIVENTTLAYGQLANHKRMLLPSSAKVVAVTGSAGKTSVKGMLKNIFSLVGETYATNKNWNNHIGVPKTLFLCPESVDFLVVEAGTSGPNEISYLTEIIDPDVALVNNIHEAHIKNFESLSAIAKEKAHIYTRGARICTPVINQEFLYFNDINQQAVKQNALIFSAGDNNENKNNKAHIYANNKKLMGNGCFVFDLYVAGRSLPVLMRVPGNHSVLNALAAAACAHACGIGLELIVEGIAGYKTDTGRMAQFSLGENILIDDTYNANPASMKAAIDVLAHYKNTILVLGCMSELGGLTESAHKEIGRYAYEAGISTFICTGVDAHFYKEGFGEKAIVFQSKSEINNYLKSIAEAPYTILVKGSRATEMNTICETLLHNQEVH